MNGPAAPRLVADVLSSPSELAALEGDWWDLWRRIPGATPFQSPAWLIPWWDAFSPGELATVTVRAGGRLVGLAAFYREDGDRGRRLLPVGISLSDYQDILVDPALGPKVRRLIVFAIEELAWDEWSLEDLRPGADALSLPAARGTTVAENRQSACPTLTLAGAKDLSGSVPGKRRRQLRRSWERARRRGEVRRADASGDPLGFLEELARLHEARWRTRDEPGVLGEPTVRTFHAQALPRLVAAGLARLRLLAIDDIVVGAYYGLTRGPEAYAYLGGFDPAYTEESPGSILIAEAMTDVLEAGGGTFHFLRGQETYKYQWGATDRWTTRRVLRRGDP